MQCKHCCSNASNSQIASLNEFIFLNRELLERRINEMISFGIKEFYISGGEPFLTKNIFELLEYLKRKNAKVSIASNGYFINENVAKRLSKIKINLLHISLDGYLDKIHNSLRGGNFFNKVVKNIKMMRKYKIPIRIGCIIWRQNENFLEEMIKLCIKLKVEELRFSWLIKVGRFKDNPNIYPKRTFVSVINEIDVLKEKYKNKIKITIHRNFKTKDSRSSQICPGGESLFFLNPTGQLSPCSWIAKIDPDFITKKTLKNTRFQKLIEEKEMISFRKLIKKRGNKNFKGCPFIAMYQHNSYHSNDSIINL